MKHKFIVAAILGTVAKDDDDGAFLGHQSFQAVAVHHPAIQHQHSTGDFFPPDQTA
jgi:hypothetical protein